jgi:hypothetical protein
MTRSSAFAIFTLLTATAATASGQEVAEAPSLPSVIDVGTRVRLRSTVLTGQPRGLVVEKDENTLTLATESGPLKIPVRSVTSLDASLGRKRRTWEGLAAGAILGALVGFGDTVDRDTCRLFSDVYCSRGEAVAVDAAAMALVGAGVGALIKSDRWSAVTLQAGPVVGARRRAASASVTLRF